MSERPGTGPSSTIGLALGMKIAPKRITGAEKRAASVASPSIALPDRFSASHVSVPVAATGGTKARAPPGTMSRDDASLFGSASACDGSSAFGSLGLTANQPGFGAAPVRGCFSSHASSAFKRPHAPRSRKRRPWSALPNAAPASGSGFGNRNNKAAVCALATLRFWRAFATTLKPAILAPTSTEKPYTRERSRPRSRSSRVAQAPFSFRASNATSPTRSPPSSHSIPPGERRKNRTDEKSLIAQTRNHNCTIRTYHEYFGKRNVARSFGPAPIRRGGPARPDTRTHRATAVSLTEENVYAYVER